MVFDVKCTFLIKYYQSRMYRIEYLNLDAITKSNSLTVQRGTGYSFQASEQNYAKDYLCVRIFSEHSLEH